MIKWPTKEKRCMFLADTHFRQNGNLPFVKASYTTYLSGMSYNQLGNNKWNL